MTILKRKMARDTTLAEMRTGQNLPCYDDGGGGTIMIWYDGGECFEL